MSTDLASPGAPGSTGPESDVRSRRLSALAQSDFEGMASSVDVLQRISELATELLPASLGASAALIEDSGYRVVATTIEGQSLDGSTTLRDEGVTAKIVENLQPVVVPDISQDPVATSELASEHGVGAYVGVPIAFDGRCLGVLYVMDDGPRSYDDDDIAFLNLLAGRAAAAVHNASIFSEMKAARERSEALAWVANAVIAAADLDEVVESVVEGVAASVAAHYVEIVTVDQGVVSSRARSGGEVPTAAELSRRVDQVIASGTVVVAADDEQPHVIAPLRAGASVMGAMEVVRKEPRFDDAEIDLIVAMANQVAIAIDNVRLLDTTRSTLRETEAMYEMAQALVAGGDLPEMLDAVAMGTVAAIPADGARIVMADDHEVTAQATAGVMDDEDAAEMLAGPLGRVLATSEPLHDERRMIVPLAVHGRLIGALEAVNDERSKAFSPHQLGTLQAAAAQAAVAIENHLLFGEVQRLAITDELTGVHTRRHLFELGQREFAQSVRFRKPLSAIMFDLDHFKEINDTLGHLVGDEVLTGVAQRCADVLREVDVLGRYGGEEFAIILPDAKAGDAVTVAERVRRAVAADPVETARGPVAVTVSLGVAEVGPGVLDLKTLLDRADAAMYEAKEAGRDQVKAA